MSRKHHPVNDTAAKPSTPVAVGERRLVPEQEPTILNSPMESRNGDHAAGGDDAIRLRAYLKWVAAGSPPGDGISFWLEAEQEVAAK